MTAKAHTKYPFVAAQMRNLQHLTNAEIAAQLRCSQNVVRECRRGFGAAGRSGWSEERAQRCKEMWLAGNSASKIACTLGGLTRSAVIGKVHRMGLSGRATSKPHNSYIRKSRPTKAPRPNPPAPSAVMAILCDGLPIPTPAEFDVPRISFSHLNEDGNKHCRWPCLESVAGVPQDQPLFCGLKPIPGQSYCPTHYVRARIPVQPRRREADVVRLVPRETVESEKLQVA
jgi:GcrA cell cycle regulator